MCRSRRELSNEYLLAKIGFDKAENEPCKVCPLSAYRSPRSMSLQSNKYVVYKKEDTKMLTTDDPEEADKSKIRWDPNDIKREIMYTYCHVKKIHGFFFWQTSSQICATFREFSTSLSAIRLKTHSQYHSHDSLIQNLFYFKF